MPLSLDFSSLQRAYAEGAASPVAVAREIAARVRARSEDAVWISRIPEAALLDAAAALERRAAADGIGAMPLYGLPFAVKDNIDVAGLPTTAACPGFAHQPVRSAPVVARLVAAGALLVGKTNLDQFATGLVGTRSPYGVPRNPFDPDFIPGGSSSGSAVAVAAGLVAFALGTDTAGSGRVPASFNNIVGLKPTRGLVSARGVVPACRSLDCV
jgi:allophanate hydrolase